LPFFEIRAMPSRRIVIIAVVHDSKLLSSSRDSVAAVPPDRYHVASKYRFVLVCCLECEGRSIEPRCQKLSAIVCTLG
jgi:hypothetical protein